MTIAQLSWEMVVDKAVPSALPACGSLGHEKEAGLEAAAAAAAAVAVRTAVQPRNRDSEATAGRSWIAGAWELGASEAAEAQAGQRKEASRPGGEAESGAWQ